VEHKYSVSGESSGAKPSGKGIDPNGYRNRQMPEAPKSFAKAGRFSGSYAYLRIMRAGFSEVSAPHCLCYSNESAIEEKILQSKPIYKSGAGGTDIPDQFCR
jgi:hypothetical protein